MKVLGFQWDRGNWSKCIKHGVSIEEIEFVFKNYPRVMKDPYSFEERMRAIGKSKVGRYIFIVFSIREGKIRPISARYMHSKEVKHYEQF